MHPYDMPQAEAEKIHVEIAKLMAETRELNAEAGKLTRETFWYPIGIATGLVTAVAGITALTIKAFA
nr:hypothetical protein [Pseudomonas sp. S44]